MFGTSCFNEMSDHLGPQTFPPHNSRVFGFASGVGSCGLFCLLFVCLLVCLSVCLFVCSVCLHLIAGEQTKHKTEWRPVFCGARAQPLMRLESYKWMLLATIIGTSDNVWDAQGNDCDHLWMPLPFYQLSRPRPRNTAIKCWRKGWYRHIMLVSN